jgi:lipoprotein-anchoring transpeptidase ErfK/SrfK
MARYQDVMSRAVTGLPLDERHATYQRARRALVERLRSLQPPLTEAAIASEQAAFEAAIQRIEAQYDEVSVAPWEPEPVTSPLLKTRQRGALIAALCCAGLIVAVLAAWLAYQYRRDVVRVANQSLRQPVVQSDAGKATLQNAPATSTIPFVFKRQLVHYRSTNPAGTVIIDKAQRYLYVILANVTAVRYGIALGGSCADAIGRYSVSRKSEPAAPRAVAGAQPQGNLSLYLESDSRLIHTTSSTSAIGQTIGSGCFQLIQADLAELYGRVPVGTRVLVN